MIALIELSHFLQPVNYKYWRYMLRWYRIWHVNYWWFKCAYCHRLENAVDEPEERDLAHQRLKNLQLNLLHTAKEQRQ